MNHVIYPLGHDRTELTRLQTQAVLLHDSHLDSLAAKSVSCLEIGCGNGANLPLLLKSNPNICYTGIDISSTAIDAAKKQFHQCKNAKFYMMNASDIKINEQFDLIFTKLVLWSVGPALREVLSEAYRLLIPGGIFYALEPCNQLIQIYPSKPAVTSWMKKWDEAAIKQGLNPYIGTSIASELILSGYYDVQAKFLPLMAFGKDGQKYQSIMNNLKGFYLGPAVEKFGLVGIHDQDKIAALNEFDTQRKESFVMDALMSTWGLRI